MCQIFSQNNFLHLQENPKTLNVVLEWVYFKQSKEKNTEDKYEFISMPRSIGRGIFWKQDAKSGAVKRKTEEA